MRKILAAIFVLLSIAAAHAAFGIFQTSGVAAPTTFTPQWQPLKMGAGGQITGIDLHTSDGTTLIRTDTYGAYLYQTASACSGWSGALNAPCWQQLVTATSIPSPTITIPYSLNLGVVEIVACNSNTNDAYMLWNGALWVTTNLQSGASVSWVKTTLTTTQDPNSGPKQAGKFIACDPNNPNIAYIGTPAGLKTTSNGLSGGSATFSTVSGVGTTGTIPSVIAYDPTSATVGGVTQRFLVFTYSTGVYETTNGGTSFTLTTSGPTTFNHMQADQFGQIWVVNDSATVYRYAGGTWHTSTISSTTADNIAFDPASVSAGAEKVVVMNYGGQPIISTNGGTSWSGPVFSAMTVSATAPQPTWMAAANLSSPGGVFLNTLDTAFDASSNLFNAGGIGVWEALAGFSTVPNWVANSVGIEQLVAISTIVGSGAAPSTAVWDRGFFTQQNPDVYPSTYWTTATSNAFGAVNAIEGGWALDYASATPTTLAGWEISNIGTGTAPATSTDGGNTYTLWSAVPASSTYSGNIAASTASNFILVPGQNKAISFTTNGGATWTTSTITGTPTNWVTQTGVRTALAADRVNANTFCAVDSNLAFWESTNSGSSFTKVANTGAVDGSANADALIAVPGQAGNFFYSSGSQGGTHPTNTHLWKTTNDCTTWTDVNVNLKEVIAFGFGAPLPGGSGYPAIYAYGWLSGVQGMYESDDGGTTWALINAPASQQVWPKNSLDFITYISGDPNVYGRIYVDFRGSGPAYIDTANACPWVNFSSVTPGASLTGTVTLTAQHSGLVPVSSVQYKVDGSNIGSALTSPPYSFAWNTGGVATGAHTLEVKTAGVNCSGDYQIPITTH